MIFIIICIALALMGLSGGLVIAYATVSLDGIDEEDL